MGDINRVLFSGRLGQNPEMKYLPDGTAVTNFSIAVSYGKDTTMWIDVSTWRATAEACNEYLGKGDEIFVDGYMREESWEGNDGRRHKKLTVVAQNVRFGSKAGSKHTDSSQGSTSKPKAEEQPSGDDTDNVTFAGFPF